MSANPRGLEKSQGQYLVESIQKLWDEWGARTWGSEGVYQAKMFKISNEAAGSLGGEGQ